MHTKGTWGVILRGGGTPRSAHGRKTGRNGEGGQTTRPALVKLPGRCSRLPTPLWSGTPGAAWASCPPQNLQDVPLCAPAMCSRCTSGRSWTATRWVVCPLSRERGGWEVQLPASPLPLCPVVRGNPAGLRQPDLVERTWDEAGVWCGCASCRLRWLFPPPPSPALTPSAARVPSCAGSDDRNIVMWSWDGPAHESVQARVTIRTGGCCLPLNSRRCSAPGVRIPTLSPGCCRSHV